VEGVGTEEAEVADEAESVVKDAICWSKVSLGEADGAVDAEKIGETKNPVT